MLARAPRAKLCSSVASMKFWGGLAYLLVPTGENTNAGARRENFEAIGFHL